MRTLHVRILNAKVPQLLVLLPLLSATAMTAYATSPCYQWTCAGYAGQCASGTLWRTSAQEAANDFSAALCASSAAPGTAGTQIRNCTATPIRGSATWPAYQYLSRSSEQRYCTHSDESSCSAWTVLSDSTDMWSNRFNTRTNPICQCYVSARALAAAQCGPARSCVGHPINPASGAVFDTFADFPSASGSPAFEHLYNSTDSGSRDLSAGWRHSFSRNIQPKYAGTDYRPYVQTQDNSSLYTDEATACISGFAEIKARLSGWGNATASYANGVCSLATGSTRIGTLTLLYTSTPTPNPSTLTLVGYDATRDDGQLVSFSVQGGSIVAPPTIGLKLQQTSSSYTLTDDSDNVESYDANGKLLSVTSHAGVVQTMSYDSSGRLSGVTDSFGHRLSLSYDGQGRLSSVTRQ